jgi:DUF1680 family protein
MNINKEIELLMHITSKHISVEEDEINVHRKTGEQVLAQLAKHFCKHRTNYYHYLKLHKDYIRNPKMHPYYIDVFNKVFDEYMTQTQRLKTINELQALDEVDIAIADLLKIRKYLLNEN